MRKGTYQLLGTAAGIALVSAAVLQVSSAAFTGSTDNADNSFSAGTVTLTDDDSGTAMFTAPGLAPGDSTTGCIEVSYTGSIAPGAPVSLHAAVSETVVGGNGLGDDLDVVVEQGAAGSSCAAPSGLATIYSGTLAGFNGAASPLSSGWTPVLATDVMRPYTFTVTLGADTPNDAQGEGADATFTWSATS